MGCGESKHAVSTADTISERKRLSDPKNVKAADQSSRNEVKIPQKDEKENAVAMPESVGDNKEREGANPGQVSTEANLKGSENVSNEKEGEIPKAKDGDQAKGEPGVEKAKEDEIKQVAAAAAAVVVEDSTEKARSETKNEEIQKENEANEIKEKEADKPAEAKELTKAGEEKIPRR